MCGANNAIVEVSLLAVNTAVMIAITDNTDIATASTTYTSTAATITVIMSSKLLIA
jgi:hypothetical protein